MYARSGCVALCALLLAACSSPQDSKPTNQASAPQPTQADTAVTGSRLGRHAPPSAVDAAKGGDAGSVQGALDQTHLGGASGR